MSPMDWLALLVVLGALVVLMRWALPRRGADT